MWGMTGMSSPAAAWQLLAARSLPPRAIIKRAKSAGDLSCGFTDGGVLFICWVMWGMIGMSSPAAALQLLAARSLPPRAIIKRAKSGTGLCPVDFRKGKALT